MMSYEQAASFGSSVRSLPHSHVTGWFLVACISGDVGNQGDTNDHDLNYL